MWEIVIRHGGKVERRIGGYATRSEALSDLREMDMMIHFTRSADVEQAEESA